MTTEASRLTIREAFDLRYHVPRSQVWEGSRGKQRGNVHLHVKAGEVFGAGRILRTERQALCGRRGWYERELEGVEGQREEDFCPRCVEVGTRPSGRVGAGSVQTDPVPPRGGDRMKHQLLRALDGIIADLREATAAIQRDDLETAVERFESARAKLREQALLLRGAA